MIVPRSLFADLPPASSTEVFETLLETAGVRIERIVSHAAASPDGFWHDQEQEEWVLVLRGEASLRFDPDGQVHLKAGDHLRIPRRCRHRVEWTSAETIWLAVHVLEKQGGH